MKKIVFDIETSNLFAEVGSNDPSALDLSVICIYDYERDAYESYLQEDLPKLWPVLESADLLIGYNSDHFDIPLLNKYYSGDLTKIKSLDILREIKNSFGRRMKLDQIAEGTLGINKSGVGIEATVWWKNGEKQKVIDYCLDDVKITKDVYEYARANNKLLFKEGGELITIPLDTSKWEEKEDSALTHTLPF
jgi:DEAD/DEAH box helicase domain-containing protein